MRRPTIADIAQRAGVTKAAVSFALNDQPGVSPATRARILQIAQEIGWQPNSAARALSDGRAGAFGLVIDRPAGFLGAEPWFIQLMVGIQSELAAAHTALLFTVAEDKQAEIELYRRWWGQRRVDGVLVVDVRLDDARIPVLKELGVPAVAIGPAQSAGGLVTVSTDDGAGARTVVQHFARLGHERIAHVTGMADLWHTRERTGALRDEARAVGIEAVSVPADYTAEGGAQATTRLLRRRTPPTAILYDNDLMAVSGLGAAQRLGVDVPDQLSIAAWEDSVLCRLVHPSLTALTHDVVAYGAHAARSLLDLLSGSSPGDQAEPAPVLTVRESTAAPAA
ncbi:MAG TPA: LacI family DNA-binding transcriptional regulator [Actinocrinis sp.]